MNKENITIQSNQKFTTGSLGFFVRLPLTKHNMALANLLCRMQMDESDLFPEAGLQQIELQKRYSFQFEAVVQLFGKELVIAYLANFIEPRQILDPDYNYRQIAETFCALATRPLISSASVKLAQRQLADEYQELLAEPSNAALSGFFNNWYADQPDYAASFMGSIEEIKAASSQDVRRFADALRTQASCIFGHVYDARQVKRLLLQQLAEEDWPGIRIDFGVDDLLIPAPDLRLEKTSEQGKQQAQLYLGYAFKGRPKLDDLATGTVLRQYLTGEQSSRLFAKVREESGAAYAVESNWFADNALFLINAGLDPEKLDLARQIISKEMQMIADGRIDPGLLKQSRQALQNRQLLNQDHSNWLLAKDLRYELHADYQDFDMAAAAGQVTSRRLADFVK
ncbi:M16 family metallopeptidase, partial [Lactobacillus nasalidis]